MLNEDECKNELKKLGYKVEKQPDGGFWIIDLKNPNEFYTAKDLAGLTSQISFLNLHSLLNTFEKLNMK